MKITLAEVKPGFVFLMNDENHRLEVERGIMTVVRGFPELKAYEDQPQRISFFVDENYLAVRLRLDSRQEVLRLGPDAFGRTKRLEAWAEAANALLTGRASTPDG